MDKSKNTGKVKKTYIGTIRVSQRGTGYLSLIEENASAEIAFKDLGTALHGDTVKISLIGGKTRDDNFKAKVTEIRKRAKHGFSGMLIKDGKDFALKATDPRMYVKILIPKNKTNGAKVGDKIFVKITKWTDMQREPLGQVKKVLGSVGDNEAEMQGIILERGFESSFPPSVDAEAKKMKGVPISEKEIANRRDMRNITTFTIDPEDAKDFDDALSFKKLSSGNFEVGIHIADVSHYVRPGSILDKEALDRATSVYLVDRTIPMLPEVISNDLCSLNPNEDKLTMSAIFEIDIRGDIQKQWFGKTIINSNKRFSYEGAQKVLDDKSGEFFEELDTLNKIAKSLNAKRIKDGAILMETDEVKFKLDKNGKPISVFIKTRGDTNKLIEEFMLLANRRVAKFGSKTSNNKDRVFIYRVHDEPNKEKIETLIEYLKLLGFNLKSHKGVVKPEEFNRLFQELEERPERDSIQSSVIRSMQKAMYSTKNIGHYGLAFEFYTHFTSPIRRYPDIIAHRLLLDYLNGKKIPNEQAAKYEKMATHCSMREVEAAEAERASIKYKQLEYMMERVGQDFDGVITGITDWGIYVAEKTTRAEGVIRLCDVTESNFICDDKKMMLKDKDTDKILRVGDDLRIKLKNVNFEKQQIDYLLIE